MTRSSPTVSPAGETRLVKIPRHVAIIMDGNGRWAQARGLPRTAGHKAGTENLRPILEAAVDFGIEIVTVYAFSTENWARPYMEVQTLLSILEQALETEVAKLHAHGVKIRHLGRTEGLAPSLVAKIRQAEELTQHNTRLQFNVAFNYGGRAEIVDAVRRLVQEGIPAEQITEETISRHLYAPDCPDPDLIIRTAGEMRLSNFLIWQAAYAEFYSTPTYWPDFDRAELYKALLAYQQRDRRFGRVHPESR
jgi:undecaprenyl diphosphate synthase